jgi:hypothetical protein
MIVRASVSFNSTPIPFDNDPKATDFRPKLFDVTTQSFKRLRYFKPSLKFCDLRLLSHNLTDLCESPGMETSYQSDGS